MKSLITALMCAGALGVAAPSMAQPYPPRDPSPAAVPGHDFRDQLQTLESRINDGRRDHTIDDSEFDRAIRELAAIRDREREMREHNGGQLDDMARSRLQERIDHLARSIHWMRENGRDGEHDRDRMGPPPPPPVVAPAPPPAGDWSLERREAWMQERIEHARIDGTLDRRAAYRAQRALNDIRTMQARLTRRDHGRLNDVDRTYIEQRLDHLRDSMSWMRRHDEDRAPWVR